MEKWGELFQLTHLTWNDLVLVDLLVFFIEFILYPEHKMYRIFTSQFGAYMLYRTYDWHSDMIASCHCIVM